MLDYIAPPFLALSIRQLVEAIPNPYQAAAFAFILSLYVYVVVRVAALGYCYADYAIATWLRQRNGRPSAVQYWLGDRIEVVHNYVALAGTLLTLAAVAYEVVAFGVQPREGTFLFQFKTLVLDFIMFLWKA
ncbi:hypothetical protein MWN33_05230 [Starkeya koreensis]|uniref:Uncharacterized protein n=1 Tax=Ancylobacter koreensis TaxID=266121 RepID=A0ABT0DJH2_9HYPH|nr:hypothetical protein [Ancylobacter koreensis]MCK0207434.1 hypothetical protein [Ancylobacter koreensis]